MRILSILLIGALSSMLTIHAAERQTLLSVSAPNLKQACKAFQQNEIGSIFCGPELADFRQFLDLTIKNEAPELHILLNQVTAIDFELAVTDDKNMPVGIRLKLSGEFGGLSEDSKMMIKRFLPPMAAVSYSESALLCSVNHENVDFTAPNQGNQVEIRWDLKELAKVTNGQEKLLVNAALNFMPSGYMKMNVKPDGFGSTLVLDKTPAGITPIDTSLIARIPENAAFLCAGIHGGDWWQEHQNDVYTIAAFNTTPIANAESVEQIKMQAKAVSTMLLGCDLDTFMSSINGTFALVFNEPILVYPNLSIIMPRGEHLDQLITRLFALGQQAMPEDGSFVFFSLKGLGPNRGALIPGAVCVGKDTGHWVFSMDSRFTESLLKNDPQDLSQRYYAKQLEKPEEICFINAIGSNQATLNAIPHIVGGVSNVFDQGRHGPALNMAAHKLIKLAKPMVSVGRSTGNGFELTQDGSPFILPPANIAIVAIIASIAIPNLMESKISANEYAAAATLKAAMHSAQISFQASRLQDANQNGTGEFGFIENLNGEAGCLGAKAGDLNFLIGKSFRRIMGHNGYRYEMYLPDGNGGAHKFEDGHPKTPEGITACESNFLVYAWPIKPNETGRRVFALMNDGQIRSPNRVIDIGPDGPEWNAIFGGGDAEWGDEIEWPFYNR